MSALINRTMLQKVNRDLCLCLSAERDRLYGRHIRQHAEGQRAVSHRWQTCTELCHPAFKVRVPARIINYVTLYHQLITSYYVLIRLYFQRDALSTGCCEISDTAAFGSEVGAVTRLLGAGASYVWCRKCVFNGHTRTSVSVIELPSMATAN